MYFSVICVLYVFLQYFDTVGGVFWRVKTVTRISYTVLVETSINQSFSQLPLKDKSADDVTELLYTAHW